MIIKYTAEGEAEWARCVGGSYQDSINSVVETSDGRYIVGGYFYSSSIEFENKITLNNHGSTTYRDGMIIKYTTAGEVEWAKSIGGSSSDYINSVAETRDGKYIVQGYLGSNVELENEVNLSSGSMLIKYTTEGEREWANTIVGNINSVVETSDGRYIVGGSFSSNIDLKNGVSLNNNGKYDGMIIKYNTIEVPEIVTKQAKSITYSCNDSVQSVSITSDKGYIVGGYLGNSNLIGNGNIIKYKNNGEEEWSKTIRDSNISQVIENEDKSIIAVGNFESSKKLGEGIIISSNGRRDGMIIKYTAIGEVEWARSIGGSNYDYITSVLETRDGGYIVGGYFNSDSINIGNGVTLSNNGSYDGMVIKYTSEGEVEWARSIGGSDDDKIYSIAATNDGGYIVGGYFISDSINLENEVSLIKNEGNSSSSSDGMLIKYDSTGEIKWAKAIWGSNYDYIELVKSTSDGGYIVGGRFEGSIKIGNDTLSSTGYSDVMVIKYTSEGEVEWAKSIGGSNWDYITSVSETSDRGYILGGRFEGSIKIGNDTLSNAGYSDGMIIKYTSEGEIEWTKGIGGSDYDGINTVEEANQGEYIVGGYFKSDSIKIGNGISLINNIDNTSYKADGMLIKIAEEMGVPDVQEITVENSRKEFKITTDVNEIDGIKGGSISGEDYSSYETVKYGDSNTEEIKMTPDENYEIIGITVNGEEYKFEELEDGSYIMPIFTNITEDKHIEVTYSLKDNKITINKVDADTKQPLQGAKFKLDQIEEREEPGEEVIGDLTANGTNYDNVDRENQETLDINLTDNGATYVQADTANEISDVVGTLTNNGTYYFVEENGTYIPTNSKTYQTANGGTAGIGGVTANSYIPIDLSDKEGTYVVVVNAEVSSQDGYDYGYATITETTTAPSYSTTTGRFMYISNTISAKDYTSLSLEGGKIYYLHLGYRKNSSTDTGDDKVTINSVKVYGTKDGTYTFIESEGKYVPTNTVGINTVANSYIPIDLSDREGKYAIVVNAETKISGSSEYLYATVTENTTAPAYNSSTNQFMKLTGTQAAKEYIKYLDAGKLYYLHLGYKNVSSTSNTAVINSIELYQSNLVTYNFVENEGKYESNNQGKDSTVANSYIPIDLSNNTGKYNLTVNAEISSQSSSDYGYATITETTTAPSYSTTTGRFIYISGTQEEKDYTTVLQGGKIYYLHLGYYKNASTSTGDDKFTINSVQVTLNDSELYHTEVETNSEGQAITQIPFGKYSITEIQAPEGYELDETPVIVEFRADENHEFTIENQKQARIIVHHYIKGTEDKLAEDDLLIGKIGENYTTSPHLDLEKYELEKDEEGNYIIPENATGVYESGDHEITYYYVEKNIPLTVHHYIEGTQNRVLLIDGSEAEDVLSQGKKGESYTTDAILEDELSSEYEFAEVPENATGTYSGEEVIVTYYYKKVERNMVLTKYQEDGVTPLEGAKFTILNKGKEIQTEEIKNNGTYYFEKQVNKYVSNNKGKSSTTANSYIKIDLTKVDKATLTVNAEISSQSGYDIGYATITESAVAPSYSSSTGQFIYISGTVSAKDYTKELEGGKVYYLHLGYRKNGSGNTGADAFTINSIKIDGKDYLEYIAYTTDTQGTIKTTLEAGEYAITEVEAPEGYALPEDSTTYITITRETEEAQVVLTNSRKQGNIVAHHYIEGTTNKVPLQDGSLAEDVIKTGNVGDIYVTKEIENLSNKYELVKLPTNSSGTITEETIEVTYYYRLKTRKVIVHYYQENTENSIAEDIIKTGKVDEEYTTNPATDIPVNYELALVPENSTGLIDVEDTEVIYYYRFKTPSIETPEITKVSTTQTVTRIGQRIPYTITYTVNVDEYIGEAVVTIVDELPYKIDTEEGKSNLDGGVYNEKNKTITWKEDISEIDTFTNGKKQINIIKNIELIYVDVDSAEAKLTNMATGTLELKTPEKESIITASEEITSELSKNTYITKVQVNEHELEQDEEGNYEVTLEADEENCNVLVQAEDKFAKVTIGGAEYTGVLEESVDLDVTAKETVKTIKITAQDGTIKEHRLTIKWLGRFTGKVKTQTAEGNPEKALVVIYNKDDERKELGKVDIINGTIPDVDEDEDGVVDGIETYREVVQKVETNEDGTFEANLIPGEYEMVILKRYYLEYRKTELSIDGGERIDLGEHKIYAGDVNEDGQIEISDLTAVTYNYGVATKENGLIIYDLNEDEVVDNVDRIILRTNYNKRSQEESWAISREEYRNRKLRRKEELKENDMGDDLAYYIKTNGIFMFPLSVAEGESYRITSPYGTRIHPTTGEESKHTGIDLQGTWHTGILAAASGEVVFAGNNGAFGNSVEIKHVVNGVEIYTFYAHLSRIDVKVGDTVEQGQVIGLEGGDASDENPGTSTGHHLHFEVRTSSGYGNDINPSYYIQF